MSSNKLSQNFLPVICIILFSQFILYVQAGNDWSQPCLSGVCSYDLPVTPNGPSGTLKIWGAENAIADITPAAGWEILSCDPQSLAQDLRIVCQTSDSSGDCAKLFASANTGAARRAVSTTSPSASTSNVDPSSTALPSDGREQGAVGKIVRLPEQCGKSAFARISKVWTPVDQSIPPSIARRLVRRDGETPVVQALSVDVDFNADSNPRHGPVGFAVVGANFPGAAAQGELDTSSISVNNSTNSRRSLTRFQYISNKRGFRDFVNNAVDTVSSLNDFDVDKSTTLQPFDLDQSFNVIDQQIKCSAPASIGGLNSSVGVNGKITVDVDAKIHAVVSLGIAASGTVVPPKVEEFGITSSMTANLDSSIIMSAGVGGTLDSGKIKLFEVGVPGLDFPGVLSIGPTFQINAQAKASLDLDVDMTVGINYNINKAEFTFPTGGSKGGSFAPGDTPLKLSVQPSGTATGTIEAHLIPSLNLGIDALGGTVSAGVFVNLDASANATLGVGATGAQRDININPRSSAPFEAEDVSENIGHLGYPVAKIRGRGLIGETFFGKRSPRPFGIGDITDGLKDAGSDVGGAIGGAVSAVKDKAGDALDTIAGNDDSDSGSDDSDTGNDDSGTGNDDSNTGSDDPNTGSDDSDAGSDDSDIGNDDSDTGSDDSNAGSDDSDTGSDGSDSGVDTSDSVAPTTTQAADVVAPSTTTGAEESPVATTSQVPEESATVGAAATPGTAEGTNNPNGGNNGDEASFGGCVEMTTGLSVNVGANANFFGLFDPSTTLPLFSKDFPLFKKCFGDPTQIQRRSEPASVKVVQNASSSISKRASGLTCNDANVGKATELVNDVVAASKLV